MKEAPLDLFSNSLGFFLDVRGHILFGGLGARDTRAWTSVLCRR